MQIDAQLQKLRRGSCPRLTSTIDSIVQKNWWHSERGYPLRYMGSDRKSEIVSKTGVG